MFENYLRFCLDRQVKRLEEVRNTRKGTCKRNATRFTLVVTSRMCQFGQFWSLCVHLGAREQHLLTIFSSLLTVF